MAEVGIIWADDADLKAIYNYVERQRPAIVNHPKLQSMIESFEKWYQGLTWFDLHVMINDTTAEAARRRDAINVEMNQVLPPDWTPADKLNNEPGSAARLPGAKPPKPPLIPTQYKLAAVITGAAVTVLVVLKKLHIL